MLIISELINNCYGDTETVICKRIKNTNELEYQERSERLTYWQKLFRTDSEIELYHKLGNIHIKLDYEVEYFTFISERFIIYLK